MFVKVKVIKFYENTKGYWYYECKPLTECGFEHFDIYSNALDAVALKKEDIKIGDEVELEIIPKVYRVFKK